MKMTKRTTKVHDRHGIADTEFIYAWDLGIIASSREKSFHLHELTLQPTALLGESGEMRKTSRAVLKNKVQVLSTQTDHRLPEVVILDACALLWIAPWPASPAKVLNFVTAAVTIIMSRCASSASVFHVVIDRYYDLKHKVMPSRVRTERVQSGIHHVRRVTTSQTGLMVLNVPALPPKPPPPTTTNKQTNKQTNLKGLK